MEFNEFFDLVIKNFIICLTFSVSIVVIVLAVIRSFHVFSKSNQNKIIVNNKDNLNKKAVD